MSGRLAGKVAGVTGGTSGIGMATAERFAAEGAKVSLTGRRQEQLDAAVDRIGHVAAHARVSAAQVAAIEAWPSRSVNGTPTSGPWRCRSWW